MTEQLKLKMNDSKATRWGALVIVAFTMMAAYYVNDVVAPLKTMLESDLAWTSSDFGTGTERRENQSVQHAYWYSCSADRSSSSSCNYCSGR